MVFHLRVDYCRYPIVAVVEPNKWRNYVVSAPTTHTHMRATYLPQLPQPKRGINSRAAVLGSKSLSVGAAGNVLEQ